MRPVLACLLLLPLTAVAQMYSWKDASGKIQYSDEPPPGKVQMRKVAPPSAPSSDAAERRKEAADRDLETRKKQQEAKDSAAKAEKEKADAEDRRANCEKARGQLQAIESGQVRFVTDAAGGRVALDGAVREAEIANARRAVDSWCK